MSTGQTQTAHELRAEARELLRRAATLERESAGPVPTIAEAVAARQEAAE